MILLITRIRNESLILKDTLDHFAQISDGIIVYDDASTDNSFEIAKKHPGVIEVIRNGSWRQDRASEETRHRQLLLEVAREKDPQWIMYADCDERFEGDIRSFLLSEDSSDIDGIKVRLLDAYMTPNDHESYQEGQALYDFREYFGPECRDILMIWKNSPAVKFQGSDKREPCLNSSRVITKFFCQHYGKAISVKQWEDTCLYYEKHFPKYSQKWSERRGKAIHKKSDFNRSLLKWEDAKRNLIKIN